MKAKKGKKPKRCRPSGHWFSEYVETVTRKGIETIVARCPMCGERAEFPAYARDRRKQPTG